jgi:hypothetical protein
MYNESVQANHNVLGPHTWSWWTNNWHGVASNPDVNLAGGDSGSSAFARKTFPWSTVGINSMSRGAMAEPFGFGLLANPFEFREFVGETLATFLPGTGYLLNFSSSSHLSTNLASKSPSNDTTSNWSVPTGSNQSGLVFRWVDDTHYYFATLSESQDYFRLVRRDGSSDKVLAQAVWTGDEATTMVIKAQALMDRLQVQLVVQSSGSVVATLKANDSRFPVGRVGVFQESNAGARFDEFKVSARTGGYDVPSVMENITGISAWSGWYDTDKSDRQRRQRDHHRDQRRRPRRLRRQHAVRRRSVRGHRGNPGRQARAADEELRTLHRMLLDAAPTEPAFVMFNNLPRVADAKRFQRIVTAPLTNLSISTPPR